MQKQVNQQAARRAMRPQVSASNAFDVMRRQGGGQPDRSAAKPAAPESEQFTGVGRNDPCPCGSGKKFKKCHGAG